MFKGMEDRLLSSQAQELVAFCQISIFVCLFFRDRISLLVLAALELALVDQALNEKEKDRVPLGMVEEKVCYRCVGEHSQGWGPLGESVVGMTRLSWAMWGEGEGKREREPGAAARRPEVQEGQGNQDVWII